MSPGANIGSLRSPCYIALEGDRLLLIRAIFNVARWQFVCLCIYPLQLYASASRGAMLTRRLSCTRASFQNSLCNLHPQRPTPSLVSEFSSVSGSEGRNVRTRWTVREEGGWRERWRGDETRRKIEGWRKARWWMTGSTVTRRMLLIINTNTTPTLKGSIGILWTENTYILYVFGHFMSLKTCCHFLH